MIKLDDNFLTISENGQETLYKSKGSKFFANVYRLKDVQDLKNILDQSREKYPKAGHHCYAYRVDSLYRSNDDGEPAHTAGDPILGQIDSYQLDHVLVVVSRIFGGTKLGVSGLIKAYKEAAKNAIEACQIITCTRTEIIKASCEYDQLSSLHNFIARNNYHIKSQNLKSTCEISIVVPLSHIAVIENKAKMLYKITWSKPN